MTVPHLIGRQHLLLRLPTAAGAADLQQRAGEALSSAALQAALDRAFAECQVGEEEWLTVTRLEVDLGTCHPDDLERHLTERLPSALAKALTQARQAASPASWTYAATTKPGPPPGLEPNTSLVTRDAVEHAASQPAASQMGALQPAASQPAASQPAASQPAASQPDALQPAALQMVTLQPAALATWQAWLYFLQYGALPPPVGQLPVRADWEAALQSLLLALPAGRLTDLRTVLGLAVARKRLVRQFSVPFVTSVIQQLTREAEVGAVPALKLATSLAAFPATTVEQVLEAFLNRVAAGKSVPWERLLYPLQAVSAASGSTTSTNALRSILSLLDDSLPVGSTPAARATRPDGLLPTPDAPEAAPESLPGATRRSSRDEPRAYTKRSSSDPTPANFVETTAAEALPEYVANAGTILLHPFLPACFTGLGWLTPAGQFVSQQAREEAALLLHFLATGAREAAEYELRLPLFLCGSPADTPPRRLLLPEACCREGVALLEAALAHWSALKGTSVDGLRAAFLQREGKLERDTPFGPALTVARQSQDVLLDRLPYGWGLGLVALPWLSAPLMVHWT